MNTTVRKNATHIDSQRVATLARKTGAASRAEAVLECLLAK